MGEYEDRFYYSPEERRAYRQRRAARRRRIRRRLMLRRALILLLLLIIGGTVALIVHHHSPAPPDGSDLPGGNPDGADGQPSPYAQLFSPLDADGDGVDDYHDILQGARDYIATKPVYNQYGYYDGGYPDDGTGVCTDVIWSALHAAGYELKDLLDADIRAHPDWYGDVEWPEPNIDFRRVTNLDDFFSRHALVLTCSFDDPGQWQGGDIVVFGDRAHIAICSDKRRADGLPWIIHHGSLEEGPVEVDAISRHRVTAHYRWGPADPAVREPLPALAENSDASAQTTKNDK